MQEYSFKSKTNTEARAYKFALAIIKFIDKVPREMSTQIITRQLLRSATSIGANIIEARSGSSRKDFTNFFSHALKSANETKFWLGLLKDANKVDLLVTEPLINEANEIANILAASILTLKGKK